MVIIFFGNVDFMFVDMCFMNLVVIDFLQEGRVIYFMVIRFVGFKVLEY